MPATVRSEFALALNQVCAERGISAEVVLETIKAAIIAAFRKDFGAEDLEKIEVKINPENGEAKILKENKDVTPPGFGRIAAQTAKQVILQKIREAEKQAIITDYSTRLKTLVNGMILRFDGPNIVVDIGKGEGIMPPEEQIRNEKYRLNQRLTFYILEIRESIKGGQIIVSRANPDLVKLLFKREVPEVQSSAVEIKEIAREAGGRTKLAVISKQAGVDPVGSCVGQKGIRVQTVINEIGGFEKVDIIQYNTDPVKFIAGSLAPAKDLVVVINEKKKLALVYVPDDQLSLAIGREGQNVRLAAKITGYKIDIKAKSELMKLKEVAEKKKTKIESKKKKGVVNKETVKEEKKEKITKKKKEVKKVKPKGKEKKNPKSLPAGRRSAWRDLPHSESGKIPRSRLSRDPE